jgi:hypothetical protein
MREEVFTPQFTCLIKKKYMKNYTKKKAQILTLAPPQAQAKDKLEAQMREEVFAAQFTGFTGTKKITKKKAQMLTLLLPQAQAKEKLEARVRDEVERAACVMVQAEEYKEQLRRCTQFPCFTGTTVRTLTLREAGWRGSGMRSVRVAGRWRRREREWRQVLSVGCRV